MRSNSTAQEREFTALLPWWSWILAAIAFTGVQVMLYFMMRRDPQHHTPAGYFWSFLTGLFMGFYMLIVGYVSRDARRRGMNPTLWIIILLCLIGSGVGFIVYFLLRDPIVKECPQCRQRIESGFNFCPNCRLELARACPHCNRTLHDGDRYCPFCGLSQDAEQAPIQAIR